MMEKELEIGKRCLMKEIFQAKEVDRVDTVLHTSPFVTCVCIIAQGQ